MSEIRTLISCTVMFCTKQNESLHHSLGLWARG